MESCYVKSTDFSNHTGGIVETLQTTNKACAENVSSTSSSLPNIGNNYQPSPINIIRWVDQAYKATKTKEVMVLI